MLVYSVFLSFLFEDFLEDWPLQAEGAILHKIKITLHYIPAMLERGNYQLVCLQTVGWREHGITISQVCDFVHVLLIARFNAERRGKRGWYLLLPKPIPLKILVTIL